MENLEIRYQEALKKIGTNRLLNLPEQVKGVLKSTTDLKTKVEILDAIGKGYSDGERMYFFTAELAEKVADFFQSNCNFVKTGVYYDPGEDKDKVTECRCWYYVAVTEKRSS